MLFINPQNHHTGGDFGQNGVNVQSPAEMVPKKERESAKMAHAREKTYNLGNAD